MVETDRLTVFGEEKDGLLSSLPTFQVRCRGCDYVQRPSWHSLAGEQVGVHVLGDRCPKCDGRMQELYLRYAGRRK
jgi:hypothetical protein